MHVVVAPNAFRAGPSSAWVAEALASGLRELPGVNRISTVPLSDGGDGAVDIVANQLSGERVYLTTKGPLGDPVNAHYFVSQDGTAFVETALSSGLHLLDGRELKPLVANTYGTGQTIRHALESGLRRLVVFAGGTASVDMGAGALVAMGAQLLTADGAVVDPEPGLMSQVARIDLDQLTAASILVLSDVSTPLAHNIDFFGAQKGIGPAEARVLRKSLGAMSGALGRSGELLSTPWLGAGGGIAAGLHAAVEADIRPGSEYFIGLSSLAESISQADLVITAEGRFDRASFNGKLPYAVAMLAAEVGKPAVIIAGKVDVSEDQLPNGVRCIELGIPMPRRREVHNPAYSRALAAAAQRAVDYIKDLR